MGLIRSIRIPALFVLLGSVISVSAAPRLRLTNTAVGPATVATGTDGPLQTVVAYNAGDGELALEASTVAGWIQTSVGDPEICTFRPGLCYPIRMALLTSGLAKGTHTGVVKVSDPNAMDAPQFVTVTVQVGGAVPEKIQFYVQPGGTEEYRIRASNPLGIIPATESGGNWLSVPLEGGGSFQFTAGQIVNYRVVGKHLAGMGEGEYAGRLTVINSRISEENKTVPVTLTVTSKPIAKIPERLPIRLAAGAVPHALILEPATRGAGQVSVSGVTATTEIGGDWLAAEPAMEGKAVRITANPSALAEGTYQGAIEISSDAANSTMRLPVDLTVVSPGAPAADYATMANIATGEAGEAVAQGSLVRLRGEQFTSQEMARAEAAPWPETLAGTRVLINGTAAALKSVAADEIVFQVPYTIEPGEAVLQVECDGQPGNSVAFSVVPRAPRLELSGVDAYAKAVLSDGLLALPESMGGRPARAGETVAVTAIGFGATEPRVDAGADPPADPRAVVNEPVLATIGAALFQEGVTVEATVSLEPGQPGRYRISFTVPEGVTPGDRVNLFVTVGGAASNRVILAIR